MPPVLFVTLPPLQMPGYSIAPGSRRMQIEGTVLGDLSGLPIVLYTHSGIFTSPVRNLPAVPDNINRENVIFTMSMVNAYLVCVIFLFSFSPTHRISVFRIFAHMPPDGDSAT